MFKVFRRIMRFVLGMLLAIPLALGVAVVVLLWLISQDKTKPPDPAKLKARLEPARPKPADKQPPDKNARQPIVLPAPSAPIELEEETPAAEAPAAEAEAPPPSEPDELRRIEGIGPKVAGLLNDAGILTFAQLAETETAKLREILDAAKLRFIKPDTWPEQAQFAAAGDWDGLARLQEELKGGQRA